MSVEIAAKVAVKRLRFQIVSGLDVKALAFGHIYGREYALGGGSSTFVAVLLEGGEMARYRCLLHLLWRWQVP